MDYRRTISNIVIQTPDISRISDGIYSGSFDTFFISADVSVVVANHEITDVIINNHYHDRGHGAEVVAIEVVNRQSLDVDTVSGATNSCLVILKAIQNALESSNE